MFAAHLRSQDVLWALGLVMVGAAAVTIGSPSPRTRDAPPPTQRPPATTTGHDTAHGDERVGAETSVAEPAVAPSRFVSPMPEKPAFDLDDDGRFSPPLRSGIDSRPPA